MRGDLFRRSIRKNALIMELAADKRRDFTQSAEECLCALLARFRKIRGRVAIMPVDHVAGIVAHRIKHDICSVDVHRVKPCFIAEGVDHLKIVRFAELREQFVIKVIMGGALCCIKEAADASVYVCLREIDRRLRDHRKRLMHMRGMLFHVL
ncbi:hypothetical protein SDC9_139431 [bioreactor metagenome]|uniref:Uncharacterized protein n=1 Tax=bioreactor metagenome TaxID=1076179 RepID=A0A645DSJ7_9ZZZZ